MKKKPKKESDFKMLFLKICPGLASDFFPKVEGKVVFLQQKETGLNQ